ncbi:MAG: hypothetical protein WAV28_15565 [Sedimentisphaerales bacterium]
MYEIYEIQAQKISAERPVRSTAPSRAAQERFRRIAPNRAVSERLRRIVAQCPVRLRLPTPLVARKQAPQPNRDLLLNTIPGYP